MKVRGLLLGRAAQFCLWLAGLGVGGAGLVVVAQPPSEKSEPSGGIAEDGATLYAENCARCHVERFASERTDAQWKTIMLHMQVRAQITGEDARKILEYLQQSN